MITGDATFSPCGLYRYTLTRAWAENYPPITWIMLNPSKADAQVNDNTISRVFDFSMRWRHGSLTVCNLFALRSTDPRHLYKSADPIGPDNDRVILEACAGRRVIVAWGVHGLLRNRGIEVLALLEGAGVKAECLGKTQDGLPGHPLRLPKKVIPFVLTKSVFH